MYKIKRLFLDIETSLMTVATFGLWPKYIPIENILSDWYVICAAWKWEGEDKIHGAQTYTKNDISIIKKLHKVISQADEIVYHNGHKFDFKKINARVVIHGLNPLYKPLQTDTLIQCKKHFAFTSNKLDYIAKALGVPGKTHTGNDLWLRCLKRDKEAINELLEYNKNDVVVLEAVFNKLRGHILNGFNPNVMSNAGEIYCPHCNGKHFHKDGFRTTRGQKYQRYECYLCHGWFSDRTKLRVNSLVK